MIVLAFWNPNTPDLGTGLILLAMFLLTFSGRELFRWIGWLALIGTLMHIANYPHDRDDWFGCAIALGVLVVLNRMMTKTMKAKANKASDATSEPAPGADSSAHQG